ncbi:LacI family DNA-binding transcriptional regulator [Pseudomonadota bacterium]
MIKRNKPPTINDVAALAGTSKRTVSRVLNRSSKVNEATRVRVQEVIEKLNYSPNRQARGLAARRSYLLGLIYDAPTLFINDIQKGILSVCGEAGYELVVHACDVESDQMVDNVMRFVTQAKLDGVIILPPISDINELAVNLDQAGCNYVRVISELEDEPWKLVVTDYLPAIAEMTRHLVDFGHRDMALISGPRTNASSQKRQEMFVQALASHGLELSSELIVEGNFTYDSGIKAAEKLLSRKQRPTAIFAANDEMAFGVMNVAYHMGLKIPDDLSVVGFDGTSFSTFVVPPLTTIVRQTDVMSRLGTQKLLAQIEKGEDDASALETMVSTRFIPRESTGPAPSS